MKSLYRFILFFGFNPITFYRNITGLPWYIRDAFRLSKQLKGSGDFRFGSVYAILTDKADSAGKLLRHYFQQDILIAQHIFKNNPDKHIDVGSRVDGFVAHVASYRPIEVIDIRPLKSDTDNINFLQIDFMKPLEAKYFDYTDSISCLHAIEHFGLGRYGDTIDADGHLKGIANLRSILKKDGRLYISTPIGKKQRIEFNAHRVFSVPYLIGVFSEGFYIEAFYYIDDEQILHKIEDINMDAGMNTSFGCHYGCGIFILRKK